MPEKKARERPFTPVQHGDVPSSRHGLGTTSESSRSPPTVSWLRDPPPSVAMQPKSRRIGAGKTAGMALNDDIKSSFAHRRTKSARRLESITCEASQAAQAQQALSRPGTPCAIDVLHEIYPRARPHSAGCLTTPRANSPVGSTKQPWRPKSARAARGNQHDDTTWETKYMGKISTVQEVLQYLKHHGLDAKTKLFHFVQRQPSDGAHPYDLVRIHDKEEAARKVVMHRQGYFTLSVQGLVQAEVATDRHGLPTMTYNFTPLGRFMYELSLHQLVKDYPFFRTFWLGRSFRAWWAIVRRCKFDKAKTHLSTWLLHTKPIFAELLLSFRHKLLNELSSEDMVVVRPLPKGPEGPPSAKGMSSLQGAGSSGAPEDVLMKIMEEQREHVMSKCVTRITKLVATVLNDLVKTSETVCRSKNTLKAELRELERDPSMGASRGLSPSKVKSELDQRSSKYNTAHISYRLLPLFIKLADYMLCKCYVDLLMANLDKLKRLMEHKPILLVTLEDVPTAGAGPEPDKRQPVAVECHESRDKGLMEEGSPVVLSPDYEAVSGFLQDVVEVLVEGVKCLPRILHAPELAPYLRPPAETLQRESTEERGKGVHMTGADMTLLIVGDKVLARTRLQSDLLTLTCFESAQKYGWKLSELQPIREFCHHWDEPKYKGSQHTLDQLVKDVLLISEWRAQMRNIPSHLECGLMLVDASAFLAPLSQTLNRALHSALSLVVSTGHKRCTQMVGFFNQSMMQLQVRPTKLEEYVAFYNRLKKVRQEERQRMEDDFRLVQGIFELVNLYGGTIPYATQAITEDLSESMASFDRVVADALVYVDSCHNTMVAVLEKQAKEVMRQGQELFNEVHHALGAATPEHHQLLATLMEKAQRVRTCEELLGTPLTVFTDLVDVGKLL